MGLHPSYRHANHVNFPTGGEHLCDVVRGHLPGEPPNMCFGGFGEGLHLFLSLSSLLGGLDLEQERSLLSCLCQEGLGEPEELLELGLQQAFPNG